MRWSRRLTICAKLTMCLMTTHWAAKYSVNSRCVFDVSMLFVINYLSIVRRISAAEETKLPCFFRRPFVYNLDRRLAIKRDSTSRQPTRDLFLGSHPFA